MKLILLLTLCAAGAPAQSVFLGAVPDGTPRSGEVALTLREAIQLGLKNNLGTIIADENSRAARAQRVRALAALLPHLSAKLLEESQQVNLAAFGFSGFPGVGSIVGPFGLFDARASLTQSVINTRQRQYLRASEESIATAGLDAKEARDGIVFAITELYLAASAAESRISAAKARVTAAQALYDQAVRFKETGMVAGIEVLRADVQLRSQKQRLIAFQNDFEKQKLRLAWAIGLDGGATIRLSDPMPAADPSSLPKLEQATNLTLDSRMDYRGLQSRLRAAELTKKAISSGRLPTVSFNADYGTIGKAVYSNHGTYSATIALNIPIFDGNRIIGDEMEADATINRLRAQIAEMRIRIQFELRSAYLDLQAAADQLEVARGTVELARKQEEQARDRFAAGVTNNLEVVQAQEALAQADENLISSLLATNLAKTALARAVGATETNIPLFLTGAKFGDK